MQTCEAPYDYTSVIGGVLGAFEAVLPERHSQGSFGVSEAYVQVGRCTSAIGNRDIGVRCVVIGQ